MQKLICYLFTLLAGFFYPASLYSQNIKETFEKKDVIKSVISTANTKKNISTDTIKTGTRKPLAPAVEKKYVQEIEDLKKRNTAKRLSNKAQKSMVTGDCCSDCTLDIFYNVNGTSGVVNPYVPLTLTTTVYSGIAINATTNCSGPGCNNTSTTIEILGNVYSGYYTDMLVQPGTYIATIKKYTDQVILCETVTITIIVEYPCPCAAADVIPQITIKNLTTGYETPIISSDFTYTVNCKDSFIIQPFYKCTSTGSLVEYPFFGCSACVYPNPTPGGGILLMPFETSGTFDVTFYTSDYFDCNVQFPVHFKVLQDSCFGPVSPDLTPTPLCGDAGFESGLLGNDWKYYYGRFTGNQGFDCSNNTSNNMTGYPHYWQYGLDANVTSNDEMPLTCINACTNVPAPALQVHQRRETAGNDLVLGNLLSRVHSGNHSMRLGNAVPNNGVEKVEKIFTVTNTNFLFSFWYALVMGKPSLTDHYTNTIPTFIIQVRDVSNPSSPVPHNDLVNLSSNLNYISSQDPILTTTYSYTDACVSLGSSTQVNPIAYKPWSFLQLDLHTLIGKTVSIEIITRDCAHCGHFCYAYLDDFCSAADATNPTGSITLGNRDTCGAGQVCVNYSLPDSAGVKGSVKLFLNLYQNGNITPLTTLTSGTTWLTATSPNPYCFTVNPALIPALNSSLNYFDYSVQGDFKFGVTTLPSQYLGLYGSGQDVLNNNDYRINCPVSNNCPSTTCQLNLNFFINGIWTPLSPAAPINLSCGETFDIDRQLTCNPINNSISVKSATLYDMNGIVQSWASTLGNNYLAIPANTTGTYYIKYVWGTATTNCDSAIYTINITCPEPCMPDCSFSGIIWGPDLPGGQVNFNCNETVQLSCNTTYQGGVKLNCTSPTSSNIINTGVIRDAAGNVITGLPVMNYHFPTAGTYSITYYKANATGNCDSCIVIFNVTCNPCPATCIVTAVVHPLAGSDIILSATPTPLKCDSSYDFSSATLTCNPVSIAMIIKEVTIIDAAGNTPAWAVGFTGTGILNIPAGTNGLFYVKYVWGTTVTRCDSVSYPINIICCNLLITSVPTCTAADANTNSIAITVTGGTPLYTYIWSNGSTAQNLTMVMPGMYWVEVTDANGCTKRDTSWIRCPSPCNFLPVALQDQLICPGASVAIGVSGVPNLFYSWTSNPVGFTSLLPNPTVTPLTLPTTYTLSITNDNPDCPAKTATVTISEDPLCQSNCCALGHWVQAPPPGPFYFTTANGTCGIDENTPVSYDCGNVNCSARIEYSIAESANPANVVFSGNTTTNILIPATTFSNGLYTMTVKVFCGTNQCSFSEHQIIVDCTPPVTNSSCNSCSVQLSNNTRTGFSQNAALHASELQQQFTFAGAGNNISELRAVVTNITINAVDENGNENTECLSCINNPAAWASIVNGTGISGITPVININGTDNNTPVTILKHQNPRQIIWANNGSTFSINNPITLSFLLPPPSSLSCCTRKATVCVKFTFRDNNCTECTVNKCFDAEIK